MDFRKKREDELNEEIDFDLAIEAEENVRAGLPRKEAMERSRKEFGNVLRIKEVTREMWWGWTSMDRLSQDIRYALRQLARSPGFALVAIATLALGIGSATAMFGVVRAVLLSPLPFAEPDRLVRITETNPLKGWTSSPAAPANFADWRKENTVFTDLAYFMPSEMFLTAGSDSANRSGNAEPQRIIGYEVSGTFFDVLGVKPALGRAFREEESYAGNHRVAMLSHGLWKDRFGGDPNILGKTISLDERNYQVVGVLPPNFRFDDRRAQIFRPAGLRQSFFVEHRRPHYLSVFARLRPGVTEAQAVDQMNAIAARLEQLYPLTNTKMGVRIDGMHHYLSKGDRLPLLLLMGAVGMLFLIVCSNIANLQLGRGSTRAREFGIRLALGAGRARLAGQLLTESLVLSLIGGGLGLALAAAAQNLILRYAPEALPAFAETRMDGWILGFGLVVTLLAPALFGITPAFSAVRESTLQDRSGNQQAGAKRGLRAVLVACEVALSVVLVAGSALLIESLIRLEAVDPGFDPQRAVVFNVVLPRVRYPKDADARQGVERIEASLKSIPGAQSVGAVLMPPLRGAGWTADVTPEGRPDGDYERELRFNCASPGFLEAASIRLLRGRNFNEFDKADTDPVFLVNETLEKVYFRGQSAVGKRIKLGRPYDEAKWALVVGVVADTKQDGMDARVRPMAYYPFSQQPSRSMWLVVRGAGIGDSMIRQAVASVDPGVAINDFEPMDRLIADSTQKHRFRASLLGGFAGIALFLATLGIYGVLAYWVSQRATEIGVRLALGAPLPRLFRMVVSEGMRPVLAGALVGLLGAAAAAKAFQTLLFGVAAINPLSYLLTAGIMVAVALAACALPALRAIRVDPLISLRGQ